MPDRYNHLAEVLLASMLAIVGLTRHIILLVVPPDLSHLYTFTLTALIGSLIGGLVSYFFNPRNEPPKIIGGRAMVCVVTGVIGTRIMGFLHPWVNELFSDPLLLIGAGVMNGGFGFILSFWFFRGGWQRAPRIAEQQLDLVEQKFKSPKSGNEQINPSSNES